jgi:fucose permease
MFFVYVGLEGGTGQWAFVDLAETRGLAPAVAGAAVTLYWAALAGGRFALGIAGDRVRAERLLDGSVALALAAAAGYLALPPAWAALLALPLLSLGLSVFFPVLLSFTPARVGAAATAHAVGIQFAAGTLGGGLFPALMGLAIQSFGAPALGVCAVVLAAALAALHAFARRVSGAGARS